MLFTLVVIKGLVSERPYTNCRALMDHREMATEWQQSGPFGQIEPPVAKRTSTDATVTDAESESEAERLRVEKRQREGE